MSDFDEGFVIGYLGVDLIKAIIFIAPLLAIAGGAYSEYQKSACIHSPQYAKQYPEICKKHLTRADAKPPRGH